MVAGGDKEKGIFQKNICKRQSFLLLQNKVVRVLVEKRNAEK